MTEVNKVEVGFDADVKSFNRGVDSMERKLENFEKKATRETQSINKRFDLMDGSLKKVEKTMDGFGDNLDMKNIQTQLEKTKKEFKETGKVGQGSLNALKNSIDKVSFDDLSQDAHKSFAYIKSDVNKLTKQVDSFNHIRYANGFENENKLIASSFSKLNSALDSSKLSLANVSKNMNSEQTKKYVASMEQAKRTMASFKNELNRTGTVSKATMAQLNTDLKAVNFNKLPLNAKKAIQQVSTHFGTLNKTFDKTNSGITRTQLRMGAMSTTSKRVVGAINNDFTVFINRINRIGTAFRNVSEVAGGVFRGTILSSLTSIIPIAGVAITSIMGIGGALGTVAGGAIGLGGVFGTTLFAVKAFTGQASTALKMLEDGQLKVTNEVKRYQAAIKGLQGDWKSLINQNQARIFNTMSNGIDMARFSLTTLNPFLVKTAEQIEKASAKMHKWVTSSKEATAAFAMLNKIGPPIFQNVLNSAGHVGNGITRIFTAFGPLFTWTGQQLEKLSKKFDIWANSSNTQRGIASFINYTKANLPTLLSAFHNTFMGIIGLFKAFSGQTAWATKGMDNLAKRFRNWAENLNKTQGFKDFIKYTRANAPRVGELIGNIVDILVAFTKAVAPIGEFMLKNMVAITGWAAKMLEAHPNIARLIAILLTFAGVLKVGAVVIGLMLGPLGRLRGLIVALIGTQRAQIIMQRLFNKEQIKSKGVIAAMGGGIKRLALWIKNLTLWQKIGRGAQALWNGITAAGTAIANGYRYAIALLTTAQGRALIKTKLMTLAMKAQGIAMAVWTGITKAAAFANKLLALSFKGIGTAIKAVPLIGWALAIIGALIYLWQTNETFRRIVTNAWNAIKQAAINVFGWLKPYLSQIWNGIKTGAIWTWNLLKNAAIATWNGIKYAVTNPMGALKSVLSAIWFGIKTAAIWAWNGIKSGVMFVVNAWIASVKYQFNFLKSFFTSIWNGIKYAAVWAWNTIKTAVMFVINGWLTAIRYQFSFLKSFFSAIWNGIKTAAVWSWNTIKTAVMWVINNFVNGIKIIFRTLKSFFVGIWNGIKSSAIWAWNAIKNGVLNAIRGLNTGVRVIISTLRNWLITAWNFIKSKVVGLARALWFGVRTAFNNLSYAVRKVVSTLRNWLITAWNFIKNKVVAIARAVWTGVRTAFNNLSAIVRRIISNLRNWLITAWNYIKNKVVGLAKALWNGVKSAFNNLSAIVRRIIHNLKNWLINTWTTIRNKVVGFAKSLWSGVKNVFNNLWNGTRDIFNKVKNFVVNLWRGIKNSVTGFVKDMWNGVKGTMNKMKDGISNIAGKIKSTFKSMVSGVVDGLNKLIDGVNWVGKKLGMDKLSHIKLSTGTTHTHKQNLVSNGRLKHGTMATVGDKGRGNGKGGYRNEVVELPNGKRFMTPSTDTNMYLPAKSKVYSGAQAQAAGLPKFSTGTGAEMAPAGGGGIWDAVNNGKKKIAGVGSSMAHSAHGAVKKTKEKAKDIAKVAGSSIAKGTGWLKGKVSDVLDFIDKPGKLVDHVFKAFGVGFDFVKEPLPADMMSGAFKMLKKSTVDKVKGWLEEAGGGDGNYIDLSRLNYGFGTPPGYPFGRHDGIDIDYKYEKLYSTIAGKAQGIKDNGNGFGNHMWIKAANAMEVIYGHMSKLAFGSKQVKPGTYLGVSGNTGKSTGPHLHYEMRRNGQAFNPIPWLKKHDKGGGGTKAGKKWAGTIKQALKMNGLPTTSAYVNAWARQIDSESGGNPKAVQGGYVDANTGGNEAKGLVQVAKGTFNAYKRKGHGNVFNPLDNLLAGIAYAKSRYGGSMLSVIGHGHGYASGGILNTPELAWLAEGGFSESIISHDPANKVKSKAIHDRTGEMLGFNEDVVVMRMVADLLRDNNKYQAEIAENTEHAANKSSVIQMNGRAVAHEIASDVNNEIKKQEDRKVKLKGGGR